MRGWCQGVFWKKDVPHSNIRASPGVQRHCPLWSGGPHAEFPAGQAIGYRNPGVTLALTAAG